MLKNIVSVFIVTSLFLMSCSDNDDSSNSGGTSLNVGNLLTQSADNYIIPAYTQSISDVNDLKSKTDVFVASPTEESLMNLQSSYRVAFISWQKAVPFDFGPAEEGSFKTIGEDINTYPVDVADLERYISSADFSLNNFDRDTRGFSAIAYLIFNGSNAEVVASYDQNRKDYLVAIVNDIVTRIDNVKTIWETQYGGAFKTNTSVAAGSSISLLYNNFLIAYENIKNYKLSLPAGMAVGQSGIDPTKLEAYYDADLSKKLIEANFEAVEAIWYGKGYDGTDGVGFEEWVQTTGQNELEANTISAFESIKSKINDIEEASLEEALNSDLASVEAIVSEFQKSTRYIKSELSPIIQVSITYNSGDGD